MTAVLPNETKTPNPLREVFSTDEILWFNDGRWGLSGYAMPNGQGKSWTNNGTIWHVHNLLGHTLFNLAHADDVKFAGPPHKDFWWEFQLVIVDARRNLLAMAVDAGTTKNFDATHVSETPQTFLVYPVPFFGLRIRQSDIRFQVGMSLKLLGELQQHSSNESAYYISGELARLCVGWLNEMLRRVAIKYFNYTPEEVAAGGDTFEIAGERFSAESYRPEWQRPSVERTMERPPRMWWPTENDLSAIRGISYTDAMHFAARWPVTYLDGEGDWESTMPGIENRVQTGDQAPAAKATQQTGAEPGKAP